MTETAIVTKPSDSIVSYSTLTRLSCRTNLTYGSVHWVHTPVGSNESIEFYYNGFLPTDDFYKTNFIVSVASSEDVYLMIDRVTARHAGKYECYDDAGDSASAELAVIDQSPSCTYVNNDNLTETEITCTASMIGELEPTMVCYRDNHRLYSRSKFGRYADDDTHSKVYLSIKAPLLENTDRTGFSCSIQATSEIAHVAVNVIVYHERVTSTIRIVSTVGDVEISDVKLTAWINEDRLYIFISVPILFAILTCLFVAIYIKSKRSRRVASLRGSDETLI